MTIHEPEDSLVIRRVFWTDDKAQGPESWFIDPDFLEGGNDKDLRIIKCRLTRISNPEHNLSNLFLSYFAGSV